MLLSPGLNYLASSCSLIKHSHFFSMDMLAYEHIINIVKIKFNGHTQFKISFRFIRIR